MAELNIQTVTAKAGQNEGDVVGFLGRSIVFLPKDPTIIGKAVRVVLWDIRPDRRGNMMYRGVPAPEITSERWKDNGDGTLSRVTVVVDWLLHESETAVLETRPRANRDGKPSIRANYSIVWGSSLETSLVENRQELVIPTEEEVESAGALTWVATGKRVEPHTTVQLPVRAVNVMAGTWLRDIYSATYDPEATISFRTVIERPDGNREELRIDHAATWGIMPQWWRVEQEAAHPVCSCGRQRREVQIADGYGKCELCRAEEICLRCSRKAKVKNLAGRLVCADCEPYESAEEMIGRLLKQEQRRSLAEDARKLTSGQALAQAEGEAILELTLDHIESSFMKQQLLQSWKGYQWYYFTSDGVYGTKLAPAALTVLEFLPQASGNGLVELVAWLAVQPKSRNDYYTATQVAGVAMPISQVLSAMQASLGSGTLRLADRLRGSEQDRIAALQRHRALQVALAEGKIPLRGLESDGMASALRVLQDEKQDYVAALGLIRRIEDRLALREQAIASGEIWTDVTVHISTESRTQTDVFAIAPDGSIIESIDQERGGRRDRYVSAYHYGDLPNTVIVVSHSHNSYGHRETEVWEVHHLPKKVSEAQQVTLKRLADETRHYFVGSGTSWNLRQVGIVTFSTPWRNALDDREAYLNQEMCSNFPIDVTQWEQTIEDEGTIVVGPYRRRSAETKAVQQAEDAELEARGLLMSLESEKQDAQGVYDSAQEAWLERDDVKDGSRPVEDGTVFLVPAFVRESREGREDLVFGPFFDWASGTQVKLVLDPFSGESQRITEQSQNVLVRVRSRSGSQVHLFEMFLRPQAGGHKQRTLGYFVVPVLSPEDFDRQIAEAEEQHKVAEAALERAKRAADEVVRRKRAEQEEVRTVAEEPQTYFSTETEILNPLAEALRRAGLGK